MKKQLNVDVIQNELRGGPAFFPGYKGSQPPAAPAEQPTLKDSIKAAHEPKATTQAHLTTQPTRPEKPTVQTPITQQAPAPVSKSPIPERANVPTPERPNGKRIITRNSFEIYEDQMDSLRILSFQEKMQGKLGSMSGMVREAIDSYLLKRNSGSK